MKPTIAQTRNILAGQTCSNCIKNIYCRKSLQRTVGTCGFWRFEDLSISVDSEKFLISAASRELRKAIDDMIMSGAYDENQL